MVEVQRQPGFAVPTRTRERPQADREPPLWHLIAGMIVFVTFLAATLIGLCSLAAWLVTGHVT